MSYSLNKIKAYRKEILLDLYNELSEGQKNVFKKMYGSVDDIEDDKIDWAIQQCERTLAKHKFKYFTTYFK